MNGLNAPREPWTYLEGVEIDNASNGLTLIFTDLRGKSLPPQNGDALLRTQVWTCGLEFATAPAETGFAGKRQSVCWDATGLSEQGFWAIENPIVSHPRWSQTSQRSLTSDERIPARIFNGYAEQVAGLYSCHKTEKLFM